jgi:hypothetical protein
MQRAHHRKSRRLNADEYFDHTGKAEDLHGRVWVGVGGTSEPSYLRTSLTSLGIDSEFDIGQDTQVATPVFLRAGQLAAGLRPKPIGFGDEAFPVGDNQMLAVGCDPDGGRVPADRDSTGKAQTSHRRRIVRDGALSPVIDYRLTARLRNRPLHANAALSELALSAICPVDKSCLTAAV